MPTLGTFVFLSLPSIGKITDQTFSDAVATPIRDDRIGKKCLPTGIGSPASTGLCDVRDRRRSWTHISLSEREKGWNSETL